MGEPVEEPPGERIGDTGGLLDEIVEVTGIVEGLPLMLVTSSYTSSAEPSILQWIDQHAHRAAVMTRTPMLKHQCMRCPPCKNMQMTARAFCKKRAAARGWA